MHESVYVTHLPVISSLIPQHVNISECAINLLLPITGTLYLGNSYVNIIVLFGEYHCCYNVIVLYVGNKRCCIVNIHTWPARVCVCVFVRMHKM